MLPNSATLADITSADWSLMTDSNASQLGLPSGFGNVVQGVADVNQCLTIILTTPKRSDPLRPTFGCDIFQFIDLPINLATPHLVREITEAITTWEPRVKLLSVKVAPVLDSSAQSGAHLTVTITWQLAIGVTPSPPQKLTIRV